MVHEVLSPRVQDRDKPDLSSQVLWVRGKLGQSLGDGLEQDAVEDFLIPEDKGVQKIGDGEDNVEVQYWKQVLFPRLDPLLFLQKLALWAMPVSAGIVRDHLFAAVIALIHVAALIGGAAGFNRPHGAETVRGHGMSAPVLWTVLAEDVRDFELLQITRIHDRYQRARIMKLAAG
jgi:hypothetical protein